MRIISRLSGSIMRHLTFSGRGLWLTTLLLATGWNAAPGRGDIPAAATPAHERIYFSALNKENRTVLGLGAGDFELRVSGQLRPLNEFRAGLPHTDRSIPLAAWILIDFNPNISAAIVERQAGAAAGIFRLLHPDSRVGVKIVSDRAETLAPLTREPAALREGFQQFAERRTELRVGARDDSIHLGRGGMLKAVELAIDEIQKFIEAEPSLAGREVRRAVMILSDGSLSPDYKTGPLYETVARDEVFLYPVLMPRATFGTWIQYYFDIAKKSGGVASSIGSMKPASGPFSWPRSNIHSNALRFNFIHMLRDLNGKYSFTLPVVPGKEARISLKCKVKGIEIRLPRKSLP